MCQKNKTTTRNKGRHHKNTTKKNICNVKTNSHWELIADVENLFKDNKTSGKNHGKTQSADTHS